MNHDTKYTKIEIEEPLIFASLRATFVLRIVISAN
jgi:hypothetical protein